MKINFNKILPYILCVVFGIFLFNECNKEPETIEVPIEKVIEIPVIEYIHDTITPDPKTVVKKEIDSLYYKKYLELKDSTERDSAYREAIRIRETNILFEDSLGFQKVDVYTKTRGEVLGQSVAFKTKPRTITIKDTIQIPVKRSLSIEGELGIPTVPGLESTPVLKAGLIYKNKKGNSLSLSYDTEGRVWIGKTFKLF